MQFQYEISKFTYIGAPNGHIIKELAADLYSDGTNAILRFNTVHDDMRVNNLIRRLVRINNHIYCSVTDNRCDNVPKSVYDYISIKIGREIKETVITLGFGVELANTELINIPLIIDDYNRVAVINAGCDPYDTLKFMNKWPYCTIMLSKNITHLEHIFSGNGLFRALKTDQSINTKLYILTSSSSMLYRYDLGYISEFILYEVVVGFRITILTTIGLEKMLVLFPHIDNIKSKKFCLTITHYGYTGVYVLTHDDNILYTYTPIGGPKSYILPAPDIIFGFI